MKKSIILFMLAVAFFLCTAISVVAVETPVDSLDVAVASMGEINSRALVYDTAEDDVHVIFIPIGAEGYTVTSVDTSIVVAHGASYKFKISVWEGYTCTSRFEVKANGKSMYADSEGVYTIDNVTEDITILVDGISDVTPPDVTLTVGEHSWTALSSSTSDFLYINERPKIEVSINDKGSEVSIIQVAISSFELSADELSTYAYWQKYTEGLTLSGDGANFIYIKAIDDGGNVTYVGSEGLVCDVLAPEINVADGETYYGVKTVKISDEYLLSITLDGKAATPSFTLVPRDDEYEIVATDKAGNVTVAKINVKRAMPVYTVPADLTAIVGQTLADVALPVTENGAFVWSLPLSTSVGGLGENKFNITFIPTNTVDYQTVSGIEVIISVTNKAHTAPVGISALSESIKGISDGKILGVSAGMEYRSENDTEWKQISGTEITGLGGGTYYVRYSASVGYEASPFVSVTVENGRMLKVTFMADGSIVDVIESAYGQPLVEIPSVPVKVGYNHATPYWDVSDFSYITEDMTVNAVYTTNTYLITFTTSPRYTIRETGVKSPVEYGSDYTFVIDMSDDYMKGIYFTVKNNGALILPDDDGVYTIENVTEVHNVEISGVVLNVSADKNTVIGIDAEKHYAIGDKLGFTAVGSGMSNESPELGDERYVPFSWTAYLTSRWDDAPYDASFTLYKQGECDIKIVYRHEIYSTTGWVPYGENAEALYTITVHKLPAGIPTGNVTLSTTVCIVLIATFTGVFIAWYAVKKKRENTK